MAALPPNSVDVGMRYIRSIAIVLVLCLMAGGVAAQSGLPVPRFVSTGADEVNVRTGPGQQYPIEWVLLRRDFPLEVIEEFDTWRRIRDPDGIEGWVHQVLLSGRRTMILRGDPVHVVREAPDDSARPVVRAEPGVVGRLLECPPPGADSTDWCRIEVEGHRGWVPRAALWGVYPTEDVR